MVSEGEARRVADLLGAPDRLRASIEEQLPLLSTWHGRHELTSTVPDWLYEDTWEPVAADPATAAGLWAVLATPEQEELATPVERELAARGARVCRVVGPDVTGVLTLASMDDTGDVPRGFAHTVDLVRAIRDGVRVWAVTRGAVAAGEPVTRPRQALVSGLGRVAALEAPESWGGVVDLPEELPDDWTARLVDSVLTPDHEDQVALRANGRFGRRLRRVRLAENAPEWSTSGTALLTGGGSELSVHLARWLAGRGADRIVLASRSARRTPEIARLQAELAYEGVSVALAACDVTDHWQVAALVTRVDGDAHPLTVVAHLASTSSRTLLESLDGTRAAAEVSAKAVGAWHLHEAVGARDLDAFLLYGSGSSLWGAAGHGAYAAASTALDALARYRRSAGLAATVLHWGGWAGSQPITDGLVSMAPAGALHALDLALRNGTVALGVADIDWSRFTPGSRRAA